MLPDPFLGDVAPGGIVGQVFLLHLDEGVADYSVLLSDAWHEWKTADAVSSSFVVR